MCLGIPGLVVAVQEGDDPMARSGIVDLQGSKIEVNLAMVPEADRGAWVLVHAGLAIEHLDGETAFENWQWLKDAKLVEGELPKLEASAGEPS